MDYVKSFTGSLVVGMFGVGLPIAVANGLWTYTNADNSTLEQWLTGRLGTGGA